MKKLLFLSLILLSGTVTAQQFPISTIYMFANPADYNVPPMSYQLQTTFPLMQSAHINWGLASTNDMSDADMNTLLDSAAIHNVNLIPDNRLFNDLGWLERIYYEAGEHNMYFSTVNGSLQSDTTGSDQPSNDPYYDREPLLEAPPNPAAYMVSGMQFPPNDPWDTYVYPYQGYFRFKVEKPPDSTTNYPVVRLEVWDTYTNQPLQSKDLTLSQFQYSNTYYTFEYTFYPPTHIFFSIRFTYNFEHSEP